MFKLLNIVIKVFVECEMRSRYNSSFSPSSSRRFVWKLMETGLITLALYLIKSSPLKLKGWTVILNTKCSPQDTLAGNNIVWLCMGVDSSLYLIWIGLTDSSAAVLRTRGILGDVWICRQMNCECGTRVNSTPQRSETNTLSWENNIWCINLSNILKAV